ncbi:MAG: YihY/virulence factor BrkB family protein [Muribaculaceae bacterium]|nr:YihY/virulence factor BrkB family protein [Muribaculaceae bacterium]
MKKLIDKCKSLYYKCLSIAKYCWEGVWRDPSDSLKVRTVKILNLSIRTFMDSDLQSRAASLTYSTLLAIVPAFALLFAIGRGFNLQDLLQEELYKFFPAQHQAMSTAISFVDSYLKQASQGVFVGIGIVFLLWTLISLLSNIENEFNNLWGVKQGRTLYRKITDYTAICLLVPILMVCAAGINVFMSTMFDVLFGDLANSAVISFLLDCAPFLLVCVAFTLSYLLIPNTTVNLKYAAISGVISGIAFQIVQVLLITGTVYVTKYNAIYGSFAFLPLLLIWLQISWLILLFGCTLTFSMQNIFHSTFTADIKDVSPTYTRKLTVAAAAVIATRFKLNQKPMTIGEMSQCYGLPIRMLGDIVEKMHNAGVVYYVLLEEEREGIAPAVDLHTFTIGDLLKAVDLEGHHDFVPEFDQRYTKLIQVMDAITEDEYKISSKFLVADIPIPLPDYGI